MVKMGKKCSTSPCLLPIFALMVLTSGCEVDSAYQDNPGEAGPAGSADPAGVAGPAGPVGATGPTGPDGPVCFGSTCAGDTEATGILTHTGGVQFTRDPLGTSVSDGAVYINPQAAGAGETLFTVADNGTQRLKIDQNGKLELFSYNNGVTSTALSLDTNSSNANDVILGIAHNGSSVFQVQVDGKTTIAGTLTVNDAVFGDGTAATLAGDDGYLIVGDVSSTNLVCDTGKVQTRNAGAADRMDLNGLGGNIEFGASSSDEVTIPGDISMGCATPFLAYRRTTNFSPGTNAVTVIVFNGEAFDLGGGYDPGSGVYRAPCDGVYTFASHLYLSSMAGATTIYTMWLYVNGLPYVKMNSIYDTLNAGVVFLHGSVKAELSANDQVTIRIETSGDSTHAVVSAATYQSYFTGFKLFY